MIVQHNLPLVDTPRQIVAKGLRTAVQILGHTKSWGEQANQQRGPRSSMLLSTFRKRQGAAGDAERHSGWQPSICLWTSPRRLGVPLSAANRRGQANGEAGLGGSCSSAQAEGLISPDKARGLVRSSGYHESVLVTCELLMLSSCLHI